MTSRERIDPMQVAKLILAIAICAALVAAAMYSTPHETSALGIAPANHARKPPPTDWHGMPNFDAHPEDAAVEFKDLIRQTKADYSRLSPDQKYWVDGYTHGNGKRMFDEQATLLKQKPTPSH